MRDHWEAKAAVQRQFFGLASPDFTTPLFAFIGRITAQKGTSRFSRAGRRAAAAAFGPHPRSERAIEKSRFSRPSSRL